MNGLYGRAGGHSERAVEGRQGDGGGREQGAMVTRHNDVRPSCCFGNSRRVPISSERMSKVLEPSDLDFSVKILTHLRRLQLNIQNSTDRIQVYTNLSSPREYAQNGNKTVQLELSRILT